MKYTEIELNTNLVHGLFSGTYETRWEVQDFADNGEEQYVAYDFKEFMQTIAEAYQNHEQEIMQKLNIPFIKNIHFTGESYSPREYNFSTDSLDFIVTIDERELAKTLEILEKDAKFETFLHDNYTSYDGFISFTPNNIRDLYIELAKKEHSNNYEQSISAIINYLAHDILNEAEYYLRIESTIHEDWSCNGYGGLNYETQCPYCYKTVDYDNETGTFPCKNKKCEKYTKYYEKYTPGNTWKR